MQAATGAGPTPLRRIGALVVGVILFIVASFVALLSVESLGLVSSDSSYDPIPLGIAVVLLAATALAVSCVTGHRQWFKVGLIAGLVAPFAGIALGLLTGSVLLGVFVTFFTLLSPALLPSFRIPGPGSSVDT